MPTKVRRYHWLFQLTGKPKRFVALILEENRYSLYVGEPTDMTLCDDLAVTGKLVGSGVAVEINKQGGGTHWLVVSPGDYSIHVWIDGTTMERIVADKYDFVFEGTKLQVRARRTTK